jgi:hypothetical protein
VDWWIFRIATSETFRAAPREVRSWPLLDVLHAHLILDADEEIRRYEEQEQRRSMKR